MPPFERHVFVCGNRREDGHPRGCCDPAAAEALHKAFKQAVAERGLQRRVRANRSGCLDQCEHGPTVVVYPDAVWYGGVTETMSPTSSIGTWSAAPRSHGCGWPTRASTPPPVRTSRAGCRPPESPDDGRVPDLRQPDRAADADGARGRPRRRQRDLHLDPRRQAAAGAAGARPPRRAAWRRWSCGSCCCSRWPGSSASPSRCSRWWAGRLGPRSHPARRRPVPARARRRSRFTRSWRASRASARPGWRRPSAP